jgi:hypothetical protein
MTPDKLQTLTVKALRQLAADEGLPHRSRMKKNDLISALTETLDDGLSTPTPTATDASSHREDASSMTAEAPPTQRHEHGDPGLPIPDYYGHDRLVLLVQDPQHLFAYWELSGDSLDRARRQLSGKADPVLILLRDDGSEQRDIDLSGGNYYLAVAPDQTYRAELALRGEDGRLVRIVASNEVHMPRALPSVNNDEEWMAVDETFSELLVMAGLPGKAGSSMTISREQAMRARLWHEVDVNPLSSGALVSSAALSSLSLASYHLHRDHS